MSGERNNCLTVPSVLSEYADPPVPKVRIWIANLDAIQASERDEIISSLNDHERARAASFRFSPDRERFELTRGLLRQLLGKALDYSPRMVAFDYGEHGKPSVRGGDQQPVRFNLSHAGGWAMFALSEEGEVGIDLETDSTLGDDQELPGLAARFLSPAAFNRWSQLSDRPGRRCELLRAWTRKEAYVKATGKGFFAELKTIRLSDLPSRFAVFDLPAPPGFAAALCVEEMSRSPVAAPDDKSV